jgi:hypothetical protein
MRAFRAVNTDEFTALNRKAKLEAFAGSYCRTLADASSDERASEATALGVDRAHLDELATRINAPLAQALADVLRLFGDRPPDAPGATEVDDLLEELLGASGHEGTIAG